MAIDIVDRLTFDSARCEATYSKGIATNIDDGIAEIKRLRAALREIADLADVRLDEAAGIARRAPAFPRPDST